MKRDFKEWIKKFKTSISDYSYYIDFEKIYANVDKLRVELNILNSLIGSKNIEDEFKNILIKYPETLECIPLLL
ncbi:MAG: DpnII family type II restriction endonuclease, partial [Malacoplasma sp.]